MQQNQNYNYRDENEIDLKELFFVLLKRWYIILLSGLTLALAAFAYAKFFVPEQFESKTSLYIINNQSDATTYSNLQIGTVLARDYEILVKGRSVLEGALQELDSELTYEQVSSMVSLNVPEDTRIVEIVVRATDPYLAKDLADAVGESASKTIAEVMGIDAINIVEKAYLPEGKCAPSISKYTMLGGMLGVVLACGVFVLMFLLNDTIKTPDDVEKCLELSTLGVIPLDKTLVEEEKKRRKVQKRSRKTSAPKRAKA